jgi:molybdopterin-binding protein
VASARRRPAPNQSIEVSGLSLAEWVCLALIETGARYGWAIVKELEPDAPIGAVWSLTPQLTYRAIEQLTKKGIVAKTGVEPGRGPGKVILRAGPDARRAVHAWLDTPVAHVRDVRTECLLKLLLRTRLGLDNRDFLRAQQDALRPIIDRLLGPGHATSDPADMLRRENARAVQRFLATALGAAGGDPSDPELRSSSDVRLSADAELHGVVAAVINGEALTTVRLTVHEGQTVTAIISRERADQLGLVPGDPARAFVAATNVVIGTNRSGDG